MTTYRGLLLIVFNVMKLYSITYLPDYIYILNSNTYFDKLSSLKRGEASDLKTIYDNKKNWYTCWSIITYFINQHNYKKTIKDSRWDTGYIKLKTTMLRKKFGRGVWDDFRKLLKDANILEVNESYSSDGELNSSGSPYPKSYRLNKDFLHSQDFELFDTKSIDEKRISKKRLLNTEDNLNTSYTSNITIDVEKSLGIIDEIAEDRKWKQVTKLSFQTRIHKFNNHDYETSCSTGRVFNKSNGLPQALRKLIKIDGESTEEIDLKSALPSILYMHTKRDEKKKYGKILEEGMLYEYFAERLFPKEITSPFKKLPVEDQKRLRAKTKKRFVHYMGGWRDTTSPNVDEVFKNEFPKLHKFIMDTEIVKPQKRVSNIQYTGELSKRLQKDESKIVVKMVGGLNERNIKSISIHDGVRVKISQFKHVKKAMELAYEVVVGISPVLDTCGYDEPEPDLNTDKYSFDIDEIYYDQEVSSMKPEWEKDEDFRQYESRNNN